MLPLTTLFAWFMGILNSKTWEYLGLMMNPETKEISQDLKKAKISIDSIEFLLNQIKDELDTEDKRQIADMLANLQMNYVEKYQESKLSVPVATNGLNAKYEEPHWIPIILKLNEETDEIVESIEDIEGEIERIKIKED